MNRKRLNKLNAIYARIPQVNCKGLCAGACSVIGMEYEERKRLIQITGRAPSVDQDLTCGYLVEGKCSVYDARPTVCRLYAVAEDLPCPHGCKPASGHLSSDAGRAIMDEVQREFGSSGNMYYSEPPVKII